MPKAPKRRAKRSRRAIRSCFTSDSRHCERSEAIHCEKDWIARYARMTKRTPMRKITRRGLIKGSAALGLTAFASPLRAARAGAGVDHAGADRGREQGSQGDPVFVDGSSGRREARQGVRGEISGHRGADRALRLGAAVPARRAGIRQQHPRRRRHQHLGRLALHPLEEERLAGAVRHRRHRAAFPARSFAIPTACPRRRGSICRRSPTTPIW